MVRIIFLLIAFFFQTFPVIGQGSGIQLPNHGKSLSDLIPDDWEILSKAEGDLNSDSIPDLAFVIKDTDPANLEINDGIGADTVDTNPRILAIYFGKQESANYQKVQQSNTFIIHRKSPTMAEPFSGIRINDDGSLEIGFAIWSNAGSWYRTVHRYNFIYQNKSFVLSRYRRTEVHRGSGKLQSYCINFLEGEMEIEDGHISSDEPESLERKKFNLDKLQTLETLNEPFEWKFQGISI